MRITYLFDPLCGWCYGAAPALERIAQREQVSLELSPTGLFAGGNARPMDKAFASYAWANDQRIALLTGQPFSETYRRRILEAEGRVFDSGPATLGVLAADLETKGRGLEALKALQHARYVDGRDTAELAIVADIIAECGLADAARRVRAPDEALLDACRGRIASALADFRRLDARGVPALAIGEGSERRVLANDVLFGDPDTVMGRLAIA